MAEPGYRTAMRRFIEPALQACVCCALAFSPASARSQPNPVASSAASPSPAPADPCGGPGRLLATANRPTVGFSACAVAPHTAVFELGYQNQVTGTPARGSVQSQVPQNFLRIGVAPRFEIDVDGPNYIATRTHMRRASRVASPTALPTPASD